MENKRIRKEILILVIGLFLILGVLAYLYYQSMFGIDYSAIDHIKESQKGPNNFSDLANDIAVTGVDDIGFIVKGEYDLEIHYGRQIIAMHRKCFSDAKYKKALSEIGIEVKFHVNEDKTIQYLVTYWGDEVEEYSRVD